MFLTTTSSLISSTCFSSVREGDDGVELSSTVAILKRSLRVHRVSSWMISVVREICWGWLWICSSRRKEAGAFKSLWGPRSLAGADCHPHRSSWFPAINNPGYEQTSDIGIFSDHFPGSIAYRTEDRIGRNTLVQYSTGVIFSSSFVLTTA